jgi:hypothetical protein
MKTDINLLSYGAQQFLEWEIFQTKILEKTKTYFLYSIFFFFFENCVVYEVTWEGSARHDTDDIIIRPMRLACLLTKVTDTHSEYVTHIAFTWQELWP